MLVYYKRQKVKYRLNTIFCIELRLARNYYALFYTFFFILTVNLKFNSLNWKLAFQLKWSQPLAY
jgi:hypothetical protein